jgi:hypothetical protein
VCDNAASSGDNAAATAASGMDFPPAPPALVSQQSSRVRFGVHGAASASSGAMSMDLNSGMVQSRDEPVCYATCVHLKMAEDWSGVIVCAFESSSGVYFFFAVGRVHRNELLIARFVAASTNTHPH